MKLLLYKLPEHESNAAVLSGQSPSRWVVVELADPDQEDLKDPGAIIRRTIANHAEWPAPGAELHVVDLDEQPRYEATVSTRRIDS